MLVRILRRPIADTAVPVAMLAGFGATVVFYALPDTPGDFAERFVPFVLSLVLLVGWPRSASRDR